MRVFIFSLIFFLFSCTEQGKEQKPVNRQSLSHQDSVIIKSAKKIISDCYFGTLITIDAGGQPKARVMEPFAPDENFVIWLATNPRSRKVSEIKNNPNVTMHYFSKRLMAYVSLTGKAKLINDSVYKQKYWKKGWEKFYSNKDKDYLLIKFVPEILELIDIPEGLTGDKNTWKPEQVLLK